MSRGAAIVNRMDEFAMLLAGAGDHVVLKAPPDEDYLAYLDQVGLPLPRVLCPQRQDANRVVTDDVIADPALVERLRNLAGVGAHLLPHGVSTVEEQLSTVAGIPIAGSPAAVCKAVNSKIYSRRAADDLGLPQTVGWTCETIEEWETAVAGSRSVLADGGRVVVKDAFGVSGKGLALVDSDTRLALLDRKIRSRAQRSGDDRLALVVEGWADKRTDLNYQVTVGHDGTVSFDFVKEAITERGVHKGHRIPARLTAAQETRIRDAGLRLGQRLASDGYRGVAGIDAIIDTSGQVLPVIEINARNNMSTYQVRMQEILVGTGQPALARQYPLRLSRRLAFKELHALLDGLLIGGPAGTGLLVNNFATVNAAAPTVRHGGATFDGRLYGLLVGETEQQLAALDSEVARRLTELGTDRTGEW